MQTNLIFEQQHDSMTVRTVGTRSCLFSIEPFPNPGRSLLSMQHCPCRALRYTFYFNPARNIRSSRQMALAKRLNVQAVPHSKSTELPFGRFISGPFQYPFLPVDGTSETPEWVAVPHNMEPPLGRFISGPFQYPFLPVDDTSQMPEQVGCTAKHGAAAWALD